MIDVGVLFCTILLLGIRIIASLDSAVLCVVLLLRVRVS